MKLKFNTGGSAPPAQPDPNTPQTPSGGAPKLKLKFGGGGGASSSAAPPPAESATPAAGASEPPKKKRPYNKKPKPADGESPAKKATKKRPRAENDDGEGPAKKPTPAPKKKKTATVDPKPAGSAQPSLKIDTKSQSHSKKPLKLSLKSAGPTSTPRLKVKHQGLPPPRPHGVGYDSGAEDAEVDPSIEHQFILRMIPGDDCEYLRKAIEEKKIGLSKKEGGADVMMRFFDREGRRAMISIRGRHYAASLVDLPAIIEGMKSWDRRGWWKSADICQMLLVFQQVKNEEEAKAVPLPKEVDDKTWAYPHGLTPPMHWVRKRRFRKRVSYRTIEAVEKEVEQLLADDEAAREKGGRSEYTLVDLARLREESEEAHAAEGMEDAEGEDFYDDNGVPIGEPNDGIGDDMDEGEDDLERMLEAEFEDDAGQGPETVADALAGATHVGGTPSSAAVGTEESSDEDDDDDEMDEDARMQQQERQQISEEIAELERELANAKKQLAEQKNPLLKNRAQNNYDSILRNIKIKKTALGEDPDD
jgi:transcription initiation factor TFIID subunit 7